ncbi:uncharacterized protein LOC128267870 [Anopheles cruzii]|uniref:uncharacterized protein LOC128267870 n=1 Tax=Anopheles cruzii TaxID=68878 RepID=UPI0022EC5FB4|nr:uncharacterized protein LOC128267870 [Anopheles cruzii]
MALVKVFTLFNSCKSPSFKNVILASANFSKSAHYRKVEQTNEETSIPLKYFGSQASRWTAQRSRSGPKKQDVPWYQLYVVNFSVAIFLIYFCVLREENQIDQDLGRSLFEHVPGLEEKQLILNYHYNKNNGIPTIDIEKRMAELNIQLETSN